MNTLETKDKTMFILCGKVERIDRGTSAMLDIFLERITPDYYKVP